MCERQKCVHHMFWLTYSPSEQLALHNPPWIETGFVRSVRGMNPDENRTHSVRLKEGSQQRPCGIDGYFYRHRIGILNLMLSRRMNQAFFGVEQVQTLALCLRVDIYGSYLVGNGVDESNSSPGSGQMLCRCCSINS